MRGYETVRSLKKSYHVVDASNATELLTEICRWIATSRTSDVRVSESALHEVAVELRSKYRLAPHSSPQEVVEQIAKAGMPAEDFVDLSQSARLAYLYGDGPSPFSSENCSEKAVYQNDENLMFVE